MNIARLGILAACAFYAVASVGCVHEPYQFGQGWPGAPEASIASTQNNGEPHVCEGRPNRVVDGVGWVLGIPGKVMLFDRRVDNHAVSAETTLAVSDYLRQNQLPDVCVRVNEYAPGSEWRRLVENRHIGAGWRYTAGTLSLVGYTLIPGRLVGGDRYNPYTNSVYVYSDVPSLAIKAAAYAKDVHRRDLPGTYAVVNQLPVLSLWHETTNTKEALDYFEAVGDSGQQAESRRILYPCYGMCIGGAFGGILGAEPLLVVGGAVAGHVSGRVPTQNAPPTPATAEAPAQATMQTSWQANETPLSGGQAPQAEVPQANGPPR